MSLENHLANLRSRHLKIEEEINSEYLRPSPDSIKIAEMKKAKLNLKEQIDETEVMLRTPVQRVS